MNELNRVAGNKRPDTKTKREKAPLRRVKPNVVNPSCFTHLIFFFIPHNRSKSGNPAQEEFGQDGKL